MVFHTFNTLLYGAALLGAYLADSYLGKFRTIFYMSLVYLLGQSVLAVGAVPSGEERWDIAGLPQQ